MDVDLTKNNLPPVAKNIEESRETSAVVGMLAFATVVSSSVLKWMDDMI